MPHSIRTSENGFLLDMKLEEVPVAFVNGLRRIALTGLPVVQLKDVRIVENTSSMSHEVLQHRVEMLPLNVSPDEASVIRETTLELRQIATDKEIIVTSDDFLIRGPRQNILLKDKELGTPMYFMTLRPHETVELHVSLGLRMTGGSNVCISTFRNAVDPLLAEENKKLYLEKGGHPKVFDMHESQRSYSRTPLGRPDKFEFHLESIGCRKARDILRDTVTTLQTAMESWCKLPIQTEEGGYVSIESEVDGHTVGALAQSLLYDGGLVGFVSYSVPHPLLPQMVVRFKPTGTAAQAIERCRVQAVALCEGILNLV